MLLGLSYIDDKCLEAGKKHDIVIKEQIFNMILLFLPCTNVVKFIAYTKNIGVFSWNVPSFHVHDFCNCLIP